MCFTVPGEPALQFTVFGMGMDLFLCSADRTQDQMCSVRRKGEGISVSLSPQWFSKAPSVMTQDILAPKRKNPIGVLLLVVKKKQQMK